VELVLYVASQLQSEPSLSCSQPSCDAFSNEETRVGAL
jgi:hypothetical protein